MAEDATPPDSSLEPAPARSVWPRLVLLAVVLVGLYWIASATGVLDQFDPERVRAAVESAGAWGWLVFLVVFTIGELVQVPGMIFVGAAVLVFGLAVGTVLALVGGVLSVCVSFFFVRGVAGSALAEIRKPWVRKVLGQLEARPVRTVLVLRLLLWLSPPLNYALAMSGMRFRDYALGSALGLAPPVVIVAMITGGVIGA